MLFPALRKLAGEGWGPIGPYRALFLLNPFTATVLASPQQTQLS